MADEPKIVYVVYHDDWGSNGGTSIYGITSRKDWAGVCVDRNAEDAQSSLETVDFDQYKLDDPEVFPQARQEGGQQKT